MKTCIRCKRKLSESEFNIRRDAKDGLQSKCKICQREVQNAYYKKDPKYRARVKKASELDRKRNREKLNEILTHSKCATCGEDDPVVLTFDHIDPANKTRDISNMMSNGYSWNKIEAEMAKCQVLCANCHLRRTSLQFGWSRAKLKTAE
jgi:5-methylcytosine-specific restriction endonuclease McrA